MSLARPWTPKQAKLAQPDLDYIAPEIQLETSKIATVSCDVFSFGLLVCSVYNGGRSLIQAGYNPAVYMRHIDRVSIRPLPVIPLHVNRPPPRKFFPSTNASGHPLPCD